MAILRVFHGWMHAVYKWMIGLASHPHSMYYLFAISFIESSFFPIPPDVMMIPMIIAAPKKAFKIATVCTVASVIGGYFGYLIGWGFFDLVARPLLEFYGYMAQFDVFKEYYNDYGAWIVIIGGVTPFPYKVITITSGVVELNLAVFGLASIFARGIRFYFIAWLLYKFGNPIRVFIEKHLGKLSMLFVILLAGGFVAIKYL
ncbi:MAG: DedA family protein [Lactobacillaceae bacterium]|jgi:membrane protein YqaA with SNARE-associated domain|nr:DedA family protein [Lactobacillaceae bacterium]